MGSKSKKTQAKGGSRVHAQELTWYDFKSRLDAGAVVFLPVGACEQHGPALPLGTDVYIPLGICERLARKIGGIVMPPIPYGYKSQPHTGGGQGYPGTTSLHGFTLVALVRDVLEELLRHGARRICLYNGHIENAMFLTEAVDLALQSRGDANARFLILRSPPFIRAETLDAIYGGSFPGWAGEHAGVYETSLMLALRPDLVAEDKLSPDSPERQPPYEIFPATADMIAETGVLSSPVGASAEKGEKLLVDVLPNALAALRREFGLPHA